jgi:hypothetical protein
MAEATYPISRSFFKVEIDGYNNLSGWVGVPQILSRTQTQEYFDDHSGRPRHLPGKKQGVVIKLERHFDSDPTLMKWHEKGSTEQRNGSIIYFDHNKKEVRRINWSAGYISSWSTTPFDVSPESEGPARERVEIVAENLFAG